MLTLEHMIYIAIATRPNHIRVGQAAFNALEAARPDLADKIRGTERDPFYLDSRLPDFWAFIYFEESKGL